jgi:hypothetical protein
MTLSRQQWSAARYAEAASFVPALGARRASPTPGTERIPGGPAPLGPRNDDLYAKRDDQ